MRSHFQALLNAALRLPVELRERLRWRRGAASGGAKIFYGFDRLPAPHETARRRRRRRRGLWGKGG